ncbi:hypothetical protein [Shimazuella alba]|uniref:Uncharacterized protein n=1 Tax=Shimazuella alba TaxID=2690964 RepID=A0A6I4VW77_9BACL|nr:hypothetical protein [Shimazuella alba]MXQ54096.1 hypothetical protein [Shimazuella alba]
MHYYEHPDGRRLKALIDLNIRCVRHVIDLRSNEPTTVTDWYEFFHG